jgi:hypothetical protein
VTYGNDESGTPYTMATNADSAFIPKVISLASIPNKYTEDVPFSIFEFLTTISTGALTYSSSNTSVATINSSTGLITLTGAGTATITANLAATATHIAGSASTTLTITPSGWLMRGEHIVGEAAYDQSGGVSLSADGNILAVGAYNNSGNGQSSGHVRVHKWNPITSSWVQLGQDIDGEAAYDRSGNSVSISADGTILAVGAFNNSGNGLYSGHVRVRKWNLATSSWVQHGQDIDGESAGDISGYLVSLSADGTILAIGAIYNSEGRGHARVYEWNPTTSSWVKLGQDIDGESFDQSGVVSLSADGTTLAVGAIYNSGNGQYSGHVRVRKLNSARLFWAQIGQDIDGESAGDNSGSSVSLSADGTILAVGAYNNYGTGQFSGHIRVHKWNPTTSSWAQHGQDIDGESAGDMSGCSVSLSADGTILAVGAIYNDGGGYNSGHTKVYKWNPTTSSWVKRGEDIDGETGENSGASVSLSADGTKLAIGAFSYSGSNSNFPYIGRVKEYEYR